MASPQTVQGDTSDSTGSDAIPRKSDVVIMADNFPSKAFLAIEHCDTHDSDVACWSEDGTQMIIKDRDEFAASYLPRYFKHSKFQSFVRQLNIYGFRTVKHHSKSDGSVVFYHCYFQRGRGDLLTKIKKSKQDRSKGRDLDDAMNKRFDVLEQRMDHMTQKLDLLISLVSSAISSDNLNLTNGCYPPSHVGGKRRRQEVDEGTAASPSTVTDPTSDSDELSSHSSSLSTASSPRPAASQRYAFNMDVVEEDKVYDCPRDFEEARKSQEYAGGDNVEADDDFKEFIDMILDDNENELDGEAAASLQQERGEYTGSDEAAKMNTSTYVNEPLRSKSNPDAVEGAHQIPETTASAVVTHDSPDDEDYDEETGLHGSSPPLTTAVEVTSVTERHHFTGSRIFMAVVIVLALITAIVVPSVVVAKNSQKKGHKKPPPPRRPPPKHNDTGFDGGRNETTFGRNETVFNRSRRKPGSASVVSSRVGPADMDFFTVALNGQAYECSAVP